MINLPPPTADEWELKGSNWSSGQQVTLTPTDGIAQCQVTNLAPGHHISVRMTVNARPQDRQWVATIGRSAFTRTGTTTATLTADHQVTDGTLTITLAGIQRATIQQITLTDHTRLPDRPHPAHVLSLQAYYPLQDLTGLRWDTSRWDRAAWTTGKPAPGILLWDRGQWDIDRWDQAPTTTAWQEILPPCTALALTRGITADGPIKTAHVGTLTITAPDALDPRATGLTYGTPIRLIHWPTRQAVFTGMLTDMQVKPTPPGTRHEYVTTLMASDHVATLASITRYGARSENTSGTETWTQRVDRLMKSAPGVPYQIGARSHTQMCPTVWETSLANHLDALVASVGGSWHVSRDGQMIITSAYPQMASTLTITDEHDSQPENGTWSMTALDIAWRASETISSITTTNHGAALDPDRNEWQADDQTITISDGSTAAAWQGSDATVDMTLASGVADATRLLLRQATDLPTPRQITIRPAHTTGPAHAGQLMSQAAALDPLTTITITMRGESYLCSTAQISHDITPKSWRTKITLTPYR